MFQIRSDNVSGAQFRVQLLLSYVFLGLLLTSCGALPPISDDASNSPSADQPDQAGLQLPPRSTANKATSLSGQSAIDQLLLSANKASEPCG
jgi:hypothetical protein